MKIGDVTRQTGVAARMLRYYEEQELLDPDRHSNGYREYTEGDVARVAMIRDLSRSGVPTRFIKIVLDRQNKPTEWTSTCDDILAGMIREQLAELESKIDCLSASRVALAEFLDEAEQPAQNRRGTPDSMPFMSS